jgi:alkylation response protein AidB-like acyl-CoA dehydrogenase
MAHYSPPLREIEFVLHDVLKATSLSDLPGFSDATAESIRAALSAAGRLLETELAPLRAAGDAGCTWNAGSVSVPIGYSAFFRRFCESGWIGISQKPEYGGAGLPFLVGKVIDELICSADLSFSMYTGLTQGCLEALDTSADDQQRRLYCNKLASGEWTGTMCITESQAGTDVGSIKTHAVEQADGSFLIHGNKIFISSGEHDLADNIVHFVLARIQGSPPGVKGLSTFVVPKFLPDEHGVPGARNAITCVSIEHKMGLRGSCTCALSFEGARGWLVGQPNQGINNMFVMMNLSRILVGLQGLGLCELATQNAIRYAKERKQGRAESGREEIIEHPDVRRMLLHMKAITEGVRVLAYETAMYVDIARQHPDDLRKEEAQDWVDLNTPILKAFSTDSAVELASMAVQVYGGHGYIKEHGIEQIVRDSKILCLYEGTNGIQAMDLVRRKIHMHDGRLYKRFFSTVRNALDSAPDDIGIISAPLSEALNALEQATSYLRRSNAQDSAFGCVDYLRAFALTYLGYNWLRISLASQCPSNCDLLPIKLATGQYFGTRILTHVPILCRSVIFSSANVSGISSVLF